MIIEKRELTFIGGLAALEIQKPSMSGVAVNTVEASSLIIAKRVSILPSTRYSRIQSDDSVEYEAIAWYSNRTRDPHPFPTYKAESITGTPFNKWSLEAVLKNNLFNYTHLATVNLSIAIRIIFSEVETRFSKSFANRRKWPSQAKVLSTIQRFGWILN